MPFSRYAFIRKVAVAALATTIVSSGTIAQTPAPPGSNTELDALEARLKQKQTQLDKLETQIASERADLQAALKELQDLRSRPSTPAAVQASAGSVPASTAPTSAGKLPPVPIKRNAACRMANLNDFNTAFLHVDDELESENGNGNGKKELNCLTAEDIAKAYRLTDEKGVKGLDPATIDRALTSETVKFRDSISRQLADSIAQSLPERANLQPGFTAAVSLSNSSRASMSYSLPVRLDRDADDRKNGLFEWQSPSVLALNASLSVPIDKGEARLASAAGDKLKAASGFSVKVGLDFSLFSRQNRPVVYRRAANVLFEAMEACLKDKKSTNNFKTTEEAKELFFKHYGLTPEYLAGNYRGRFGAEISADTLKKAKDKEDEDTLPSAANAQAALDAKFEPKCTGSELVRWILEVERDESQTSGLKRKRPDLSDKFWQLFWDDGGEYSPNWGAGVSFEHSWTDYKYRQATLNLVPDSRDPSKVVLEPNTGVPLAAPNEHPRRAGLAAEAYLSFFKTFWKNPFMTPAGPYSRGMMGLFSVAYREGYEFRDGTENYTYCETPKPGEQFGTCSTLNIDAPYHRTGFELAAELRTQFTNVPLVKLVGLAPKYTYRLKDGAQSIDLPIFLTADDKGVGQSGVRVLHTWNGEDLLGNNLTGQWKVAFFFSTKLDLLGR